MIKVSLINNWAFRLLTPPIYAIFIYVLVLLFFGSASKLADHFFSMEYFICVLLCYVNFDLWRLVIRICSKFCKSNPWKQILYQSIAVVISSLVINYLLVSAYFKFIVGLFNYQSELSIFIALFIFSSLLYQMVYLSIFLLNYQHQDIINKQRQLKNEADANWQKFQNKINPQLLYKSLETLIGLVHNKHHNADELIAQLSGIYRKILDYNDDLIALQKEFELVSSLNKLIHIIYEDTVKITLDKATAQNEGFLLPGYLILLIQSIINENISSALQPLLMDIKIGNKSVQLVYKENKSLNVNTNSVSLKNENAQIEWYTKIAVTETLNDQGIKIISIPIINIE